jgi:hypothetical protein
MLFYKKTFNLIKKNTFNYYILIQTSSAKTWLSFIKKFKYIYFQSILTQIKKYTFIKSAHKYSSAKRQIISKIFLYSNSFFLKKKDFSFLRFFLLYSPAGLSISLKKKT